MSSLLPANTEEHPELMLGYETSDDAAVYRLGDDLAAVLTADFFTPIVDDPYDFGRIAAANALSDVFAMGARPLVALNLLALDCELGGEVAKEILRGGSENVREAGAFIMGGHTIDDAEPKYGLAVFGTVHPGKIVRNAGAQPGDALYLTKPLGTGIMSAAFKVGSETDESFRPIIETMAELNAAAATAMLEAGVHAATDVTGFGLAGHLHEMMEASGTSALLDWDALPLFDKAWDYAAQYCRPARAFAIMDYAAPFIEQGDIDDETFDNRMAILCDPQTSGGLLVAISEENAELFERTFESLSSRKPSRIGYVTKGAPGTLSFS